MSSDHQHSEGHSHGVEVELYRDSGIAETSKPFYRWMWVFYALMGVFFHGYMADQFWAQSSELPFFGPGWEVQTQNGVPLDWSPSTAVQGSPSVAILGKDEAYDPADNKYMSSYGRFR